MANWTVDPAHSDVEFKVKHLMINTVKGAFTSYRLSVDSEAPDFSDAKVAFEADIDSINHTAICVHDLPRAVRFYCDVLGATPHQRTNFSTEDALAGVAVFESVILEDYLLALGVAPGLVHHDRLGLRHPARRPAHAKAGAVERRQAGRACRTKIA